MSQRRGMQNERIIFEAPRLALTRVEAADALHISPATLDRLVKRDLIHPSRATRRPLFSVAEIERFLRDTTAEVAA
jgi:DNA-binding transcriptional MerR regulator